MSQDFAQKLTFQDAKQHGTRSSRLSSTKDTWATRAITTTHPGMLFDLKFGQKKPLIEIEKEIKKK